ncbi:MAG: alkaline phosphatase [Gammaproteobacteria bacterium]|nr:alkaline phosphatase [Gammaproteobacteria bacterium]
MKMNKLRSFLLALSLFSCAVVQAESPKQWYQDGQQALQQALANTVNTNQAKNVILLVGDGMSISTITATRIFQGQKMGQMGEENKLTFEQLPYVALAKTYNVDQQVPDSAGTMTAMMTGIKTRAGVISVNQHAIRSNCLSSKENGTETLLEQMEDLGYATGIVSTARITHATPAATYAHAPERDWEADSKIPSVEQKQGCEDIASQMVNFNHGDGIEVVLGGGRRNFLPLEENDPEYPQLATGIREDGRNLINEWQHKYASGQYVWNAKQFEQINPVTTDKLLGLFEPSHMRYHVDRPLDGAGEPTLAEMTDKAIQILQKSNTGFFLMVEAGRIDHGHHAANPHLALNDTIALDNTVKRILEMVNLDDTLLIVTADHSHVFTMAGYPKRGNPILGKVKSNHPVQDNAVSEYALAKDGLPYTTLSYANGGKRLPEHTTKCFSPSCKVAPHRSDLTMVDTEHRDHVHESLIPLSSETHSGEDVAIFAAGPWAHLFTGVYEQNYIYHVMKHALQLK